MAGPDKLRIIKQASDADLAAMHARETLSTLQKDAQNIETQIQMLQAEIDMFRSTYSSARIALQNANQLPNTARQSYEAVIELQERLEESLLELQQIQKRKSEAIFDSGDKFDDDGIDPKSPTIH